MHTKSLKLNKADNFWDDSKSRQFCFENSFYRVAAVPCSHNAPWLGGDGLGFWMPKSNLTNPGSTPLHVFHPQHIISTSPNHAPMHYAIHRSMHGVACPSTKTPIRPHRTEGHQDYMILLSRAKLCLAVNILELASFVYLMAMKTFRLLVKTRAG